MPGKTHRSILGAVAASLLLLGGCTATTGQGSYGDPSYVDEVEFLSEYGEWMEHYDYGMVWLPYVVSGWHPYYNGHWIWTGDG
ncbi:MAG TPA: DUF6600 domain-containing protein, partial [Candidatus Krumholzibacterium sp.]|nr:DUF6600 domain-containing protein [Candidatus Krumholzibacterium sp.]